MQSAFGRKLPLCGLLVAVFALMAAATAPAAHAETYYGTVTLTQPIQETYYVGGGGTVQVPFAASHTVGLRDAIPNWPFTLHRNFGLGWDDNATVENIDDDVVYGMEVTASASGTWSDSGNTSGNRTPGIGDYGAFAGSFLADNFAAGLLVEETDGRAFFVR